MTAFQIIMLSVHGVPEIPTGGSVERRLKSRIRRRLAVVDCTRAPSELGNVRLLIGRLTIFNSNAVLNDQKDVKDEQYLAGFETRG